MDDGEFAPAPCCPRSRRPEFAESAPGRTALITLLEKAGEGIEGRTGTLIRQ